MDGTFSPTELSALAHRARLLWSTEPVATGDERTVLLSTLTDTELEIERLQVRATIGRLEDRDERIARRAEQHVEALERCWRSSVPPPAALGETGSEAWR